MVFCFGLYIALLGLRIVSLYADGKAAHTWVARKREINWELIGNPSLLATFHSTERCYVECWSRERHQRPYPELEAAVVCYNIK